VRKLDKLESVNVVAYGNFAPSMVIPSILKFVQVRVRVNWLEMGLFGRNCSTPPAKLFECVDFLAKSNSIFLHSSNVPSDSFYCSDRLLNESALNELKKSEEFIRT